MLNITLPFELLMLSISLNANVPAGAKPRWGCCADCACTEPAIQHTHEIAAMI
jgi:hypothetical protein